MGSPWEILDILFCHEFFIILVAIGLAWYFKSQRIFYSGGPNDEQPLINNQFPGYWQAFHQNLSKVLFKLLVISILVLIIMASSIIILVRLKDASLI